MNKRELTLNVVFIIGNGFDLHLNLKTKMKDFFTSYIFKKENNRYIYDGNNLIYFLLFYRYFANGSYNYNYFRRVDNNDPTWMDIEGFIKKIATDSKIKKLLFEAYISVLKDTFYFTYNSSPITLPAKRIFEKRTISPSGSESFINQMLLDDLVEFEKDFRTYMIEQVKTANEYDKNKEIFLEKIVKQIFDKEESIILTHIYNFNYTSLGSAATYSSNVHGSLEKNVVIGFDSTTIKDYGECIFELSKDWQKVAIDESEIDLKNLGSKHIVFYGHSLGEQDYPYFFEIFDQLRLLEKASDTTLYFVYSEFGDVKEQQSFMRNYQINIAKLLNSYENYKNSSLIRNTIITKLKAQNRLKVVKIVD